MTAYQPTDLPNRHVVIEDVDGGTERLLGEFVKTEEDSVLYIGGDGEGHWAPVDCVRILPVQGWYRR